MKELIVGLVISMVLALVIWGIACAQTQPTTPSQPQAEITPQPDIHPQRTITFRVNEDGKLDVFLKGYTGITEAADEFLKYMVAQGICNPSPSKPEEPKK